MTGIWWTVRVVGRLQNTAPRELVALGINLSLNPEIVKHCCGADTLKVLIGRVYKTKDSLVMKARVCPLPFVQLLYRCPRCSVASRQRAALVALDGVWTCS